MQDLERVLIQPDATLKEAMTVIGRGAVGIALVVDPERRLVGTVTDGDVRRAVLDGVSLDEKVHVLLLRRPANYEAPTVAAVGTPRSEVLKLMTRKSLRQIPLLDEAGRVMDVVLLSDLAKEHELGLTAVVMAGGLGTRLHPLTEELPKPMLPVGGRPLLELIIEQLRKAGIHRVIIAAHYKAEKIIEHFGDGSNFGVELRYVTEDRPLGTAGALGLMEAPHEPLLVVNGDILTRMDFRAMLAYHEEHKAAVTVGVRKYELNVPFGVIESNGVLVRSMVEKPLLSLLVSAGIYLLDPSVHRYIPSNQRFDMTELLQRLLDVGQPIVSFPILEYWLDIGDYPDYLQVQKDVRHGRLAA